MKTRISPGWVLGLALAATAAARGFADGLNSSPTGSSEAIGAAAPSPAVTPAAAPQSSPTALAVPGNTGTQQLPSNPPLSPWSLEIQRLAQAGVDERVILLYITNSAGIFNLSPEQIIYLKSLSVSPQVLSAMIWHEQELISGTQPLMTAATAPAATPAPSSPAPGESQIVANAESWAGEPLALVDDYYAPEQPESAGPVRVPYAVKLSDPIIILKLPTFALPCW